MKKNHLPGPIPPGNQSNAGPKSKKSDRALQNENNENHDLEKGGEREHGDREDVRQTYGHVPAARHDGTQRTN